MAKQPRVWSGTQWEPLAVTLPDLSNYSTTTQMNTAISNANGLVYITSSDFTTSSSVILDNIFTSAYTNYKIVIGGTGTGNSWLNYRYRNGSPAADYTTANYNEAHTERTNVGFYSGAGASLTYGYCGETGTTGWISEIIINNPFSSTVASTLEARGYIHSGGATLNIYHIGGGINATTSFTGIDIYPNSGTITGSVKVYGYKN